MCLACPTVRLHNKASRGAAKAGLPVPCDVPVDPDLAALYAAWSRLGRATRNEQLLYRAWIRGSDLAVASPQEAWDLALAVLDGTNERSVAHDVGINLLEDLVRDHAAHFIDRLECAVFTSDRVALAVASMWTTGDPVSERFRALVRIARERTALLRDL
jgi:hypothetical protein